MFRLLCHPERLIFARIAAVSVVWSVIVVGSSQRAAEAAESVCRVLKVNESAWVLPGGSTVRRTAQKGMTLAEGDVIEVTKNNSVDLSFDGAGENVLHLEGEARLQIQSGGRSIRLGLDKGKVYSLLDGLEKIDTRNFDITTPLSVSSVRGTYFSVEMSGAAAQTTVYKGYTQVAARKPDGRLFGAVYLRPAQTTEVREGAAPSKPTIAARAFFDRINRILELFDFFREKVDYDSAVAALNADANAKAANSPASDSRAVLVRLDSAENFSSSSEGNASGDSASPSSADSGKVIF